MCALKYNNPNVVQLLKYCRQERICPMIIRHENVIKSVLTNINVGEINILIELIENYGDSVDKNGDTLLHYFARLGLNSEDAINYCLDLTNGKLLYLANERNRKNQTALYIAIANLPKTKSIFNALVKLDKLDDDQKVKCLVKAISNGADIFDDLYKYCNVDILKISDERSMTPLCYIVQQKQLDILKILIEKYEINLNVTDDKGRNILHILSYFCIDSPYVFDYLISKNINFDQLINQKDTTEQGYTPLLAAVVTRNWYVFKQLFERFEPDLMIKGGYGCEFNVFQAAIKYLDVEVLCKMLKRCPILADVSLETGETPVMIAIRCKNISLAKLLIKEYKVDIGMKDNYDNTMLHYLAVCEVTDKDLINLLLNSEHNIRYLCNDRNSNGQTALEIAQKKDNVELILALWKAVELKNTYCDALLEEKKPLASIEQAILTMQNDPPSSMIPYTEQVQVTEDKLSSEGPHKIPKASKVQDIKILPVESDHTVLIPQSKSSGTVKQDNKPITLTEKTIYIPFVKQSDNESIISSTTQNLYVGTKFWKEFCETVRQNNLENVKILIQKLEMYPIPTDSKLNTALHHISRVSNVGPNIIEYIFMETIVIKNQINARNKVGNTPLHIAVSREHIPLINILLKQPNIKTRQPNEQGETPLITAIKNQKNTFKQDIIKILIKQDKDLVRIPESHGWTPLQVAILHNHLDIVKLLLEKNGVDLYMKTKTQDTLLHFLASHYYVLNPKVLDFLMRKPYNLLKYLNYTNKDDNTPLHISAKANNVEFVRYLLKIPNIDVDRLNKVQETSLFTALSSNMQNTSPVIIQMLVKKSPILATKPNFVGIQPILIALNVKHLLAIKIFLDDGGIDVNRWKDKQNNTLLHYYFLYNVQNKDIFQVLLKKGKRIINVRNSLGDTVLHFACRDNCTYAINSLLNHQNIEMTAKNYDGDTPLMNLINESCNVSEEIIAVINLMIKRTPILKTLKNKKGLLPIHKAIQYNLFDAKYLLLFCSQDSQHIYLDSKDNDNNNLLHYIAMYVLNNELLIRELLEKMSQKEILKAIHEVNSNKQTPLDVANLKDNRAFLNVIEHYKEKIKTLFCAKFQLN